MAGRRVAPVLLVACFVTSSVVAARAADPHAVLELFTSQGCSSCPPADRLVGQLANDPSLIALSIPIDYWDYLGWRDTLANPAHSARQRAYARARGDGQVYTPQIVVNGATDALGSDQGAVERAIVQANHNAGVMSLPVLVSVSNGAVNVNVHLPQCGAQLGQARQFKRDPGQLERADFSDQHRWHRRRSGHGAGRHARAARHYSWRSLYASPLNGPRTTKHGWELRQLLILSPVLRHLFPE